MTEYTVHRSPEDGRTLTPCCGRSATGFRREALTTDPTRVTCDGSFRPLMGGTSITVERLLAIERMYPRHTGAKEQLIRKTLGTKPAHYYVLLNRAIDTDAAVAMDPILVRHLREQRRRRLAARSARTGSWSADA